MVPIPLPIAKLVAVEKNTNHTNSMSPDSVESFSFLFRGISFRLKLDRHEGVGLGLDHGHAVDLLDFLQKGFLRGVAGLFPVAVLGFGKSDDDLEVQASTADDALNALDAVDGLDLGLGLVEDLLELGQAFLVVVGRPLAAPFAGDGIEFDSFRDGDHGACPVVSVFVFARGWIV